MSAKKQVVYILTPYHVEHLEGDETKVSSVTVLQTRKEIHTASSSPSKWGRRTKIKASHFVSLFATVATYELTSCHLSLAALKSLPSMKVIAVKNPITLMNYFPQQVWGRSVPDRTTGAKPNWSRPTRAKVAGHRDLMGIRSRVLNHKFTVGAKRRPPQVTIRLNAR